VSRTLGEERAPFVLITGGKGGVGKTTLAANLGVELALRGADPIAVDLDFGLADLAVVLKLEPDRDSEDFFAGRRTLEDCLVRGPAGLRVLAAGAEARDPARDGERRARLCAGLDELRSPRGIVLADSPAGIGPDVLEFALGADRVLIVTTPDPAALTDAYCTLKALDARSRKLGREIPTPDVFVNLAADAAEARSVAGRLRAVCERFLSRSPRLVGWMPRSRGVLSASARQEPFLLTDPRSLSARAVRRLARRLIRPPAGPATESPLFLGAAHGTADHGR